MSLGVAEPLLPAVVAAGGVPTGRQEPCAQTPPAGQQKLPPDTFVHLQVFPKDTKPDVPIQAMKNFTRALGVRCTRRTRAEAARPLTRRILADVVVPDQVSVI